MTFLWWSGILLALSQTSLTLPHTSLALPHFTFIEKMLPLSRIFESNWCITGTGSKNFELQPCGTSQSIHLWPLNQWETQTIHYCSLTNERVRELQLSVSAATQYFHYQSPQCTRYFTAFLVRRCVPRKGFGILWISCLWNCTLSIYPSVHKQLTYIL